MRKVIFLMLNVLVVSLFTLLLVPMTHAMLHYKLSWTFDVDIGDSSTSFYGCPPMIADINNDGYLEIIVGDYSYGVSKSVFCLDGDGNKIWGFDAGGGKYAGVQTWSPDIADIDNDGKLEIVVVSSDRSGLGNNRIIALHSDGTELWRHITPHHTPTAPRIADINNDGELEIIGGEGVGAFENGRVYVLDNLGNELWSHSCGRYVNVNVADINNDGKIEVIVCSGYGDNHLYVFDGFGNVLWSRPIDSRWIPSTGDIDNDGLLEIIVGFISGQHGGVRAFDADGNIIWTYSTVEQVQSSPAIVDIDGDGFADVIFGSNDRNLYVFDKDGAVIWSYTTGGGVRSPIVEDLDNDGNLEIIVGNWDGNIYCINNEGAEIWTYYIGTTVEKVAVGDINADGKLEVLAGIDKLYALVESTTTDALEEMVETIETWNLPKGIENGLTSKLDAVIHLLNKGNENGAIHTLMGFINQVEAFREKKLTNEQADQLISEAQRIINLFQE